MSGHQSKFGAVFLELSVVVRAFLLPVAVYLVDRLGGAKVAGAKDIHALEVALFDVIRQVTAGTDMGSLFVGTGQRIAATPGFFFCASSLARHSENRALKSCVHAGEVPDGEAQFLKLPAPAPC